MGFLALLKHTGKLEALQNQLSLVFSDPSLTNTYLSILDSFNPNKQGDSFPLFHKFYMDHASALTADANLGLANVLRLLKSVDYALLKEANKEYPGLLESLMSEEKSKESAVVEVEEVPEATLIAADPLCLPITMDIPVQSQTRMPEVTINKEPKEGLCAPTIVSEGVVYKALKESNILVEVASFLLLLDKHIKGECK